ncbi:MAG: hypothetical protein JSR66_09955 [Proteobacteria bacterium]|nr:hypothetical protein [Pseudomonadota bacterium]
MNHHAAIAVLVLWFLSGSVDAVGRSAPPIRSSARALTVTESINTTRIMVGPPKFTYDPIAGYARVFENVEISPKGDRYALMLISGDLERNGNWISIIAGTRRSLASAGPRTVLKLFTNALGEGGGGSRGAGDLLLPTNNPLRWLPNGREVALFWPGRDGRRQVLAVDVLTGRSRYLTESSTDVLEYTVADDGALFFAARTPITETLDETAEKRGFVVQNVDALGLLRGNFAGASAYDSEYNNLRFVQRAGSRSPELLRSAGSPIDRFLPIDRRVPSLFSPANHKVIYARTPDAVPPSWDVYIDKFTKLAIQSLRQGDDIYGRQVQQLFVADVRTSTTHPLWNAPLMWFPDVQYGKPVNLIWSQDESRVLVFPTFLPPSEPEEAGRRGEACAIVDVETGRFEVIRLPPKMEGVPIAAAKWRGSEYVELHTVSGSDLILQKSHGKWVGSTTEERARPSKLRGGIAIRIEQDINTPPKLVATDPRTGSRRVLLDINPALESSFTLGRVEPSHWFDSGGQRWSGRLYYPVHYVDGKRFALVIQTHGSAGVHEFSLNGLGADSGEPGLGPGISTYAAQPLANRDLFVLQMRDEDFAVGAQNEADLYADAYESAVKSLHLRGLVDSARVGLSGYSRTGWHVEYALTHSKFPYAAALCSDNIDAGYMQWMLIPGYGEVENGVAPFKEGLEKWILRAPAFNAENVTTPLRLQVEGGKHLILFSGWEMYVRLRRLNRPVEMVVIPDIDHGSHEIQNPEQLRFSQEGAVDWFDFWLNGHEDATAEKHDQYARWERLREIQRRVEPREPPVLTR